MAGDDRDVRQLIGLMLAGSAGLPLAAGAMDVITGPTNASNSGELPMNVLLSLMGPAGMGLGAAAAAAMAPRGEAVAASQLLPIGVDRELLAMKAARAKVQTPADIQRLVDQRLALDQREADVEAAMRAKIDKLRQRDRFSADPRGDATYSADAAGVQRFRRAGVNQLLTGALAGSALGAVAAINQMGDARSASIR